MRKSGLYRELGESISGVWKGPGVGHEKDTVADAQRGTMGPWTRVLLVEMKGLKRFEIDFQDGNDKIW